MRAFTVAGILIVWLGPSAQTTVALSPDTTVNLGGTTFSDQEALIYNGIDAGANIINGVVTPTP